MPFVTKIDLKLIFPKALWAAVAVSFNVKKLERWNISLEKICYPIFDLVN